MLTAMETLENCRFCLMCRHVAPVGLVTRKEALTPHGLGLLVTSEKRGLVEWNTETVEAIFSEVDGGNSRAHCVNSLPFEEALAEIRAGLVADGLANTAVSQTLAQIETYETPFAQELPRSASGTGGVALFVGDEAPYLWPEALAGAQRLLSTVGIEPVLIGYGRNNGFIPQSLGAPDLAKRLAQKNLAELEASGADTLLVLSAGDYFAWEQMMSERLGVKRPLTVTLKELTTYLTEQGASFDPINIESAAYIDPTHAVRVPERHGRIRELITAVIQPPTHELFFRRDRAHPVGSTHLQFAQPALADQLTQARLQDAQNSGAKTLICEDPATLHHLNRFAHAYGLEVKGLYELLSKL